MLKISEKSSPINKNDPYSVLPKKSARTKRKVGKSTEIDKHIYLRIRVYQVYTVPGIYMLYYYYITNTINIDSNT